MGVGAPTPLRTWEISDNASDSPRWKSSTQIEFNYKITANLLIVHIL
jgi:hypothetical protein